MKKREQLKELFGSMSESSDSPSASPPPGVWPPTINPSRSYPVPRVGTKVQRGDGSQRQHTRWMREPSPAPPKFNPRGQGRPTTTTVTGEPTTIASAGSDRMKGPVTTARTSAAGPAEATNSGATTSGQTRKPAKSGKVRPVKPSMLASSATHCRTCTPDHQRAAKTVIDGPGPENSGASQSETLAGTTNQEAKKSLGPSIRSMEVLRPPRAEVKTVAGLERVSSTGTDARPNSKRRSLSRRTQDQPGHVHNTNEPPRHHHRHQPYKRPQQPRH
ncbi:hypothetical protein PUN28_020697 [Cardiocondyla obscurior]|uniref:Uncharacterized protein n=1 Tax=Cardiocondyla obscurior TaxID=286306 RepID=A0AAW2E8V6_9HYME